MTLTIGVKEDNIDAGSVDGYEGSELAVLAENETVSGSWVYTSGLYVDGSHDADQDDICNIAAVFNIHDGGSKQLLGSAKWDGRWEYTRDTDGAWQMSLGENPVKFAVAPSGSEGNEATFANVFQAKNSGGEGLLGIGTDPSYRLDAAGDIRAQSAFRVNGYQIRGDGNGNLEILTPAGNRQKFYNGGDIGAFQ